MIQFAVLVTFIRTVIEAIEKLWPAFDTHDDWKRIAAFALSGLFEGIYRPDALAGTLFATYLWFDWTVTGFGLAVSVMVGNDIFKVIQNASTALESQ